ncbi:MAG: hypothetical protein QOF01_2908 [Thermomicrobiales bacterium]|nr:hypothetical protein [Thermomicrobiales bacterium]
MATHSGVGQMGFPSPRIAGVLVGRSREQDFLREELGAALSGYGRLVLLGGEAGIGKTTLARDLAHEAEALGASVLVGHCYDLTHTPPYGPWLELFESDQIGVRLRTPPAPLGGGGLTRVTDQAALFAEVRRFVAELSSFDPVFILLEDLHWADPASVDLLRYIGVYLSQWPAILVATYRLDELSRRHPFYQQLPALVREANGLRLDLKGLDADAFHALVSARYHLSVADQSRLVAYLERHAEGNPFFAVELLRALEEEGLLRRGNDRSSLGELARLVVPPLLRQVIDGRVARLGEETRQPLEIAAVIGQEIPLDLWGALVDLDDEALLAIVEHAVEAHLLEAERDGTRVRFVHALTREALYEGILPPRRRLWHCRVAEALAADAGAVPDAVALHFQQAGDPRAWEWLVKAGDRAQRVYAWLTASERLRAAVALLEGVEGQERMHRELVFRVAYLVRFSDPASSIAARDEVEQLAGRIGDSVLVAEVQHIRGIELCYSDRFRAGLAEMQKSLDVLEAMPLDAARASAAIRAWFTEAVSVTTPVDLAEDEPVVERLYAAGFDFRRCTHLWHNAAAGQPGAAAAIGERFVAALADVPGARGGVRAAAAFAHHGLGIAYAASGRPKEASLAWAKGREKFREIDHFALIAFSLLGELRDVALTYGAAEPTARRRLAAEAEAALGRAGGALRPGVSPRLAWLGCLVLDGRWDDADQILRDLPAPGNTYLRREVTDTIATLARYRGKPEIAWAHIGTLLPDGPGTEPGDIIHQEGLLLQRLAADICLDGGDLATARAWLEAHDRWLGWSESVLGRADGRVAWARWHQAAGDATRAGTLASDALALAAAPDQPFVRLSAHRLLGEIETAAQRHADAEAHLQASLELADECEAPFEHALTMLALAELCRAMGAHGRVLSILEEVRAVCVPLGAKPTLARVEALAGRSAARHPADTYPAGLTQREVDVLRLLAKHHTDKEIAEALFVGLRTVQTHVANILNKLGVENRREAAAEAVRLGLI